MLTNIGKLTFGFFRGNLPYPLIGSVRLWNESSYIDIALNPRPVLQVNQKVYDSLFLCNLFSLRERKANHEIEFCLVPASLFGIENDINKVLGVDFLVQAKLPCFFGCLNGKSKAGFSNFR